MTVVPPRVGDASQSQHRVLCASLPVGAACPTSGKLVSVEVAPLLQCCCCPRGICATTPLTSFMLVTPVKFLWGVGQLSTVPLVMPLFEGWMIHDGTMMCMESDIWPFSTFWSPDGDSLAGRCLGVLQTWLPCLQRNWSGVSCLVPR